MRGGFLTGYEQHPSIAAHRAQRAEQQCRLADAGLAADEHERGRHEPAAEHAVELGDAGRDPGRLVGGDVDQPQQRLGRGLRLPDLADDLLDERPERGAAWAFAEPAAGGVAALRARVLNRRLGQAYGSWLRAKRENPTGAATTTLSLRREADETVTPNTKRAPAASGPAAQSIGAPTGLVPPPFVGSGSRLTTRPLRPASRAAP